MPDREERRDKMGGPRIVIWPYPQFWRCMVCGAMVAHVDDHYAWHGKVEQSDRDKVKG